MGQHRSEFKWTHADRGHPVRQRAEHTQPGRARVLHDGLMILVVKLGAKIDKGSSTAPGQ